MANETYGNGLCYFLNLFIALRSLKMSENYSKFMLRGCFLKNCKLLTKN